MESEIITYINQKPIYGNPKNFLPYNPALKSRSKKLRKAGVMSEVVFWRQVRAGSFHDIDFDRQRIIGNYIVDFYVKKLSLVIEIDGSSHNDKDTYDARRDIYLKSLGLKIYRISEPNIMNDLENAMIGLENYIVSQFGRPV
jgi:very-short-patch-repair endonuclease